MFDGCALIEYPLRTNQAQHGCGHERGDERHDDHHREQRGRDHFDIQADMEEKHYFASCFLVAPEFAIDIQA